MGPEAILSRPVKKKLGLLVNRQAIAYVISPEQFINTWVHKGLGSNDRNMLRVCKTHCYVGLHNCRFFMIKKKFLNNIIFVEFPKCLTNRRAISTASHARRNSFSSQHKVEVIAGVGVDIPADIICFSFFRHAFCLIGILKKLCRNLVLQYFKTNHKSIAALLQVANNLS